MGFMEQLRELHRRHLQAREVQQRLERGPKIVRARQQFTLQKAREAEEHKEKLKQLRVSADQKTLQLRSNESKIRDLKMRLNQASSNREFDIIKGQIEADTVANSVLEDEILETLEKVDRAQLELRRLEDELAAARKEEQRIAADVTAAEAGLKVQAAELSQGISQAESILSGDVATSYRRLVQAHGADALAEVEGSICSHCYVAVPPQMLVGINSGQIIFCKTCGRLLYKADTPA